MIRKGIVTVFVALVAAGLAGCTGEYKTAGIRDAVVPLRTRTITIQVSGGPEEALQSTEAVLTGRGYAIASMDEEEGTLSTEYRQIENGPSLSLTADVVEGEPARVQLRGLMQTGIGSVAPIEKIGRPGSAFRKAWAEMFLTAQAMGSVVQYQ